MPWLKRMPVIARKASVLYGELPLNKYTKSPTKGSLAFLRRYNLLSSFTRPQEDQVLPVNLADGCVLYTLLHISCILRIKTSCFRRPTELMN